MSEDYFLVINYFMDQNLYQLVSDDDCNCVVVDVLNDEGFQWNNSSIQKPVVDWSQLQYQNTYKTYDYVASKFAGDWSNIPGFDKVIEQISDRQMTPLEELQERFNVAINHNDESKHNPNIPKLKDS